LLAVGCSAPSVAIEGLDQALQQARCERLGRCSAPQSNGSPCNAYNECASFYCEAGPVFDSCKDPPVCF
jgi:hypothetical protein